MFIFTFDKQELSVYFPAVGDSWVLFCQEMVELLFLLAGRGNSNSKYCIVLLASTPQFFANLMNGIFY